MERQCERGSEAGRRFVVTAGALRTAAGLFREGDVVTDALLAECLDDLLILRAVREDDYALESLFDGLDAAPRE